MNTLTFAPKKKNPIIKMDDTEENKEWKNDLQKRFQENMDKETILKVPNSSQLRAPRKKKPFMNNSSDELLKFGEDHQRTFETNMNDAE